MLLDLIFLAIRLANKESNTSAPTRIKTPAGEVTLECPFCGALTVAPQFNLSQRNGSGWQRIMDIYECPNCQRSMNAEAMRNDGTGVLIAKLWECPSCQASNPATQFVCSSCGIRLR